jgi:putative transposase
MDDKIFHLYGKGMTTRDIVDTFDELYGAEISPTLIYLVTNSVIDQVIEWPSRPVVKITENNKVINKAVFLALGVNLEGQ